MAGNCFVEVGSDEWEAWSKVRHWPQNDFDVDGNGRHKRGWYFPTPWPSSEFKPKLNGGSVPVQSGAVG